MAQDATTFTENAKVHHKMLGNGTYIREHVDGVLIDFPACAPSRVILDATELTAGHRVATRRLRSRRRRLLGDER